MVPTYEYNKGVWTWPTVAAYYASLAAIGYAFGRYVFSPADAWALFFGLDR